MLIKSSLLLLAASLALSGCASSSATFRPFPPEAASWRDPNGAWLVKAGPYADDCWMYGWGCSMPGVNPNITIGGPYPNPRSPVYVEVPRGPIVCTPQRRVRHTAPRRAYHARPHC